MPTQTCSDVVVLRDGFSVEWRVVERMIDLEFRGFRFAALDGGRLGVIPGSRLDPDERAFIRANRDAILRVVHYCELESRRPL